MRNICKSKLLFLISVLTLIFALTATYAQNVGKDISQSVLRLHIIANSNSDADQSLKLKVRNKIISDAGQLFSNCQSLDEAIKIANTNNQKLKQIAEKEIHAQGFDYPVNISVVKTAFPTKTYGNITLPSGKYTALRLEIGEAKGKNWWCVMYPPLCFTDGVLSASGLANSKLKSELKPSEYSLITKENSGAIPVEIRFKIVEVFQNLLD